jgi:deoxyinosine 3'endonuclease (endonuclease V)
MIISFHRLFLIQMSESISSSLDEWIDIQNTLKLKVITNDVFDYDEIKLIGGVDISFDKKDPSKICAYLIVMKFDDLSIVYEDHLSDELKIPYVSGFLGFREVPFYLRLLEKQKQSHPLLFPDILLVDGFGTLHHRGFGSASHLGVLCGIPTIGCGKTLLCYDGLNEKDVRQKIKEENIKELDLVGQSGLIHGKAVLTGLSNPIYVSVGHKISLETAVKVVNKLCPFRVPEPIRLADIRSKLYF